MPRSQPRGLPTRGRDGRRPGAALACANRPREGDDVPVNGRAGEPAPPPSPPPPTLCGQPTSRNPPSQLGAQDAAAVRPPRWPVSVRAREHASTPFFLVGSVVVCRGARVEGRRGGRGAFRAVCAPLVAPGTAVPVVQYLPRRPQLGTSTRGHSLTETADDGCLRVKVPNNAVCQRRITVGVSTRMPFVVHVLSHLPVSSDRGQLPEHVRAL